MLAFGALVATASGAASADNVPVEVKVIQSDVSPPSGYSPPWGCSETQPGPGNALHVICVNPEKVATKPPRTGDPVQISGYLGSSDGFDRAITVFAEQYAVVNARDHAMFLDAIKDGSVQAAT